MSKKLSLTLPLVLVLALVVSASAGETVIASFEKPEADAGLKVGVADVLTNLSAKPVWPMMQGKDACSYDPNFGPGLVVPAATNGDSVLGLLWTNEEDGRADISLQWPSGKNFDLVKNDKILLDVYIADTNAIPGTIELWDTELAWLMAHHDLIEPNKWFTVTFDLSELQDTGKRKADHSQISTIYLKDMPSKSGKVFFDNLRLESAAAPAPAAAPAAPKSE
ncbi:MAG: hypothetical protein WC476_08720 [Phycisphaerae bacterium]|jgi:hypothetical protein